MATVAGWLQKLVLRLGQMTALIGLLATGGLASAGPPQPVRGSEIITFAAGDLQLGLRWKAEGLSVEWLTDSATGILLATNKAPLFTLVLRGLNPSKMVH